MATTPRFFFDSDEIACLAPSASGEVLSLFDHARWLRPPMSSPELAGGVYDAFLHHFHGSSLLLNWIQPVSLADPFRVSALFVRTDGERARALLAVHRRAGSAPLAGPHVLSCYLRAVEADSDEIKVSSLAHAYTLSRAAGTVSLLGRTSLVLWRRDGDERLRVRAELSPILYAASRGGGVHVAVWPTLSPRKAMLTLRACASSPSATLDVAVLVPLVGCKAAQWLSVYAERRWAAAVTSANVEVNRARLVHVVFVGAGRTACASAMVDREGFNASYGESLRISRSDALHWRVSARGFSVALSTLWADDDAHARPRAASRVRLGYNAVRGAFSTGVHIVFDDA